VILGGAALSRHYCETDLRATYEGRTYYGRDAFEGLRLMDAIVGGKEDGLNAGIEERVTKRAGGGEEVENAKSGKTRRGPRGGGGGWGGGRWEGGGGAKK